MLYKIVTATILGDGTVVDGRKIHNIVWPTELDVGGLYFFFAGRPSYSKLYRVVEKVV